MNILGTSFVAVLLLGSSIVSQAACRVPGSVVPRKIHRGMYVSLIASRVLGNVTAENTLLSFINKYQFDSLSLYDLPTIMSSSAYKSQLSSFIQAAKACGVTEVSAIGASTNSFNQVSTYQSAHTGKFDGLVTEIEFWNGSNISSQFASFISTLKAMQAMGVTPPLITPYIGWLNKDMYMSEAQAATQIAANTGRVFVHAYVTNPVNAYGYVKSRVNALLAAKPSLPVWPIFSAEGNLYRAGSERFMGDWLAANSLDAAESIFMQSYVPAGFMYFEYSYLKAYLK